LPITVFVLSLQFCQIPFRADMADRCDCNRIESYFALGRCFRHLHQPEKALPHFQAALETYRKLHLVPFTENFPYKERLPRIYQWLKDADTHFWEEGDEYTVFDAAGVRFSTPIWRRLW